MPRPPDRRAGGHFRWQRPCASTPVVYRGALDDLSLSLDPLSGNRFALAAGNPIGYTEVDGHALDKSTDGTAADLNRAKATTAATQARWAVQDAANSVIPAIFSSGADPMFSGHTTPVPAIDTHDYMPCGGGVSERVRKNSLAQSALCHGTYLGPPCDNEVEGFLTAISLVPGGGDVRAGKVAAEEGPGIARGLWRLAFRGEDAAKATRARFVVNASGDVLDTTRVTIPVGKFGYLLNSRDKAGVFRASLGFDQQSLGAALRRHLENNFGTASASEAIVGGGTKFRVTGPLTGPSGATWDITSVRGVDPDGTIRLITATP